MRSLKNSVEKLISNEVWSNGLLGKQGYTYACVPGGGGERMEEGVTGPQEGRRVRHEGEKEGIYRPPSTE